MGKQKWDSDFFFKKTSRREREPGSWRADATRCDVSQADRLCLPLIELVRYHYWSDTTERERERREVFALCSFKTAYCSFKCDEFMILTAVVLVEGRPTQLIILKYFHLSRLINVGFACGIAVLSASHHRTTLSCAYIHVWFLSFSLVKTAVLWWGFFFFLPSVDDPDRSMTTYTFPSGSKSICRDKDGGETVNQLNSWVQQEGRPSSTNKHTSAHGGRSLSSPPLHSALSASPSSSLLSFLCSTPSLQTPFPPGMNIQSVSAI